MLRPEQHRECPLPPDPSAVGRVVHPGGGPRGQEAVAGSAALDHRLITSGGVRSQTHASLAGLGYQDGLDSVDLQAAETAAAEGLVHAAHQVGGLGGQRMEGAVASLS
ncbi:hypothetical protein GCM10010521_48470 [Streptomyces rameus]|uniref:Uncharacterized protein n=1 Tax=Streptomyces rameus TaxID=68261 RepID=A0ABP6NPT0_9ACTN